MARAPSPAPRTFRNQASFRAWLTTHHATTRELTVRLFKVHAASRGLTYRQALDEALCFGWIDGIVRRYDEDSFTQRYTPRQAKSTWSRVNIGHVERLIREARMTPAGLAAYQARDANRPGVYSFEQRRRALAPAMLKRLRAHAAAWAFFQAQPAGYRRGVAHWVMSAKRDDTRARRFEAVLACAASGRRIDPLSPYSCAGMP